MAATTAFTLLGLDIAKGKLLRRMRKLENWREPLTLLAQDFYKVQRGWLDSEGRGSWAPLSENYAMWKRKKLGGIDKPILQFTGALYSDLTGESSGSMRVQRDRLTLRTPRSGNRWLQHAEGRDRRPVRNPLSPALRLRRKTWAKILTDWAESK